jgi:hypothetical protein
MDIGEVLEAVFGEFRFYAGLNRKLFAEISITEERIDIRIINPVVAIEAMLIHVFKRARISSKKLKLLKEAGYEITVRYGKMKFTM